jgi:hypothetical protein
VDASQKERGVFSGFEVLKAPGPTLQSAAKRQTLAPGLVAVAIWGLLNAALTLISTGEGDFEAWFPELPPGSFAEIEGFLTGFATAAGGLGPFFWWIGVSGLLFLSARLFGGDADFRAVFAVVGIACAPWIVADALILLLVAFGLVFGPALAATLGVLSFAVSLAALVWHVALVILGVSVAGGMGYGGASATFGLAGFGCLTATLFLVLTLAVLLVGISGMFG